MNFYMLAPHYTNYAGHDHTYQHAVRTAVEQSGMRFTLLTSKKDAPPDTTPYFSGRVWKDYASLFKGGGSARRYFFHESCTSKELLAFSWSALFKSHKRDHVWLLLRYGKHQLPLKGFGHQVLISLLKWRLKRRFVGFTDSALIAQQFDLRLLPIPHTQPAPPSHSSICWWPGPPRKEKGLELIRELAPKRGKFQLALSKGAKIACDHPLPEELTPEMYQQWMGKSRVILLPYDPHTYRSGTSGIFVEGVVAGKMPLVRGGTWMAHELQRFDLEELIVDWKAPHFFDQVEARLSDQGVQAKLEKMQQAYAAYHNIDRFAAEFDQAFKYSQTGCS